MRGTGLRFPTRIVTIGTGWTTVSRGMRMAFSVALAGADMDPEVAEIVRRAVEVFEALGAEVVETGPDFGDVKGIFRAHWWSGATRVVRSIPPEMRERVDRDLLRIAERGEAIELPGYLGAVEARGALGTALKLFHRALPRAPDADITRPRIRRGGTRAAGIRRRGRRLDRVGTVLLPVQLEPATGCVRSLRVYPRRPARRAADRRPDA